MIAALYVEKDGVYFGLPGVDPYDAERDARLYAGPWPVIAHPPCERYGRYWGGGPSARVKRTKGDDQGCFAAALAAVRRYGGVLEHPEASHAWPMFGLNDPPKAGHWVVADWEGGWTCRVEQGHYGHRARKATWLYAHGGSEGPAGPSGSIDLPELIWGPAPTGARLEDGFHSASERARVLAGRRATKTGIAQRLSHRQRAATPLPFRDLLLGMVATVERRALAS